MYNSRVLVFSIIIVILSNLSGHYFPPSSIMMTPIVLLLTTSCVCLAMQNINIILRSVLSYLFIAMNDILIKLYAGGKHDSEGLDWVHAFLFIGLIGSSLILLIATFWNNKKDKLEYKLAALVVFAGLIFLHSTLFSRLGYGRSY